jgi:hypothetical protein
VVQPARLIEPFGWGDSWMARPDVCRTTTIIRRATLGHVAARALGYCGIVISDTVPARWATAIEAMVGHLGSQVQMERDGGVSWLRVVGIWQHTTKVSQKSSVFSHAPFARQREHIGKAYPPRIDSLVLRSMRDRDGSRRPTQCQGKLCSRDQSLHKSDRTPPVLVYCEI